MTSPAHIFQSQGRQIQVFVLGDGAGIEAHQHAHGHDLLVLSGSVRVNIGPISKELEAGSQVLFQPGAVHSFQAKGPATVACVIDDAAIRTNTGAAITPRVDQMLEQGVDLEALTEKAREIERDCDKYRYALQDALNGTFRVYLPATADLSDDDLNEMARSCGWIVSPGTVQPPEAWAAWLGRLRRFASLVKNQGTSHV